MKHSLYYYYIRAKKCTEGAETKTSRDEEGERTQVDEFHIFMAAKANFPYSKALDGRDN